MQIQISLKKIKKIVKSCSFALLLQPCKVESDLIDYSKALFGLYSYKIYGSSDWN